MKRILIIVTGSIAAYKIIDLVRFLENEKFCISVIATKSALEFFSVMALKSLTNAKFYHDDVFQDPMLHILLAREHDAILVAPASANCIAKLSVGMTESLSLSIILAAKIPVLIAPAMNPAMFNHNATQENLNKIKTFGYTIIGPDCGVVACKEEGYGKFTTFENILEKLTEIFIVDNAALVGKRAIVTLGATKEAIDPVRYLSNYSSGTQGIDIVRALRQQGCEVVIIAGDIKSEINDALRANTADEILKLSIDNLPADIYISVAAICDFKPKTYSDNKIKKNSDYILELESNIDVVSTISNHKKRPSIVVGFALESDNIHEYALSKMAKKNLDVIVLNKTADLTSSCKDYTIYSKSLREDYVNISKKTLAEKLVNMIINLNK